MAHRGKSGSKRREAERGDGRKISVPLSPEVTKLVRETLAVARSFPLHSMSANSTRVELFVRLIREFGLDTAIAVLNEAHRGKLPELSTLYTSAVRALGRAQRRHEIKRFLARLHFETSGLITAYTLMTQEVEEKERVLMTAEMRELVARLDNQRDRFDAIFKIYLVSHDPKDNEYLKDHFDERFALARYDQDDLRVLFSYASYSYNVELMLSYLLILERSPAGSVRTAGEAHLHDLMLLWDQELILALADAASGSLYEPEIRRLASGARKREDIRALSQSEAEDSNAP